MERFATILVLTICSAIATSAKSGDESPFPPQSEQTHGILQSSVGDYDPSLACQLQHKLAIEQIMRAMYGKHRTDRLLALDACECLEDPWPVMFHVAALMGARDRQVASRASLVLLNGLRGIEKADLMEKEVIRPRIRQLSKQLLSHAVDARLDVDVRVAALTAAGVLRDFGGTMAIPTAELIDDKEAPIRGTAVSLVRVPAEQATLTRLAKIARDDPDLALRGQAAALLCENALSYEVAELSRDLFAILREVLGNGEIPGDGMGPILACLVRFPDVARHELIDLVRENPDTSIRRYWGELTGD